jgi:hypothetical protein
VHHLENLGVEFGVFFVAAVGVSNADRPYTVHGRRATDDEYTVKSSAVVKVGCTHGRS